MMQKDIYEVKLNDRQNIALNKAIKHLENANHQIDVILYEYGNAEEASRIARSNSQNALRSLRNLYFGRKIYLQLDPDPYGLDPIQKA